ncbi:MAG: serine hydrolase domain-containing protein [Pseudomonadota bacterium]
MKCVLVVISALLSIAFPGVLRAEVSDQTLQTIDSFVRDRQAQLKVPGVAVAIVHRDEIVFAKGFGTVGPSGEFVSPTSSFQIGSITKPITAVAVMQLVDEGAVGLDDPVTKYIPTFRTRQIEGSNKITIRHLLAHRSGISMLVGNRNQRGGGVDQNAIARAVTDISRYSLVSEPGEKFQYSNANYQILSRIIEVVDGVSFETAISTRIFSRLGMTDSYVGRRSNNITPVIGHRYWLTKVVPTRFIAGREVVGQGGVVTSARDLATFMIEFIADGGDLVSRESARLMTTPYSLEEDYGYALGWETKGLDNDKLVFHSGANVGFSAFAGFSPSRQTGFVVLTNANFGFVTGNVESLTRGVAAILFDQDPPPAALPKLNLLSFSVLVVV